METVVTVESVQWNWMEWRELLWPQSISHRWEQISCSELCGPLMLLAVGFEYVPHSCFRVSKTINMCTYDSCLLDHPSRDSYLMWTSHAQQVVSLAQTSPWCFVPLTVIAKDRQGAWTFKNPRSGHQLFMCFQAVVELLRHSLERFRVTAYIASKSYEMMLHFETATVCSWKYV